MANSIKFIEGLSQIEGAPLKSPYDLRNAYIEPSHTVRALDAPIEDVTVPDQSVKKRLYKHAGNWVRTQTGSRYQSIFYAVDEYPNRISVYHKGSQRAETDVPRIVEIANVRRGAAALNANRLIMYCMIPVNHRGEAGVWRYKMINTGEDAATLPIFVLQANERTQYVEVYRTAEMKPNIQDSIESVQALHYLGRFSGDSGARGTTLEYYTSIPPESGEDPDNYHDKTGIDYIYVSGQQIWWRTDQRTPTEDVALGSRDYTGWRVEFRELESGSSLSENTTYFVSANTDAKLFLEDSGGNALSFDPKYLLKESESSAPGSDQGRRWAGYRVDLFPPSTSLQTGSKISVVDGKQWNYELGEESTERPNQPTSRILERDRSLHGRTEARDQTISVTSDAFVVNGDKREFYEEDKIIIYNPGIDFRTKSVFGGEVKVGGSATLTLDKTSGALLVILKNVTLQSSGDVQVLYEVKNGTSPYTVTLQRRYAENINQPFSNQTTDTVSNSGQFGITESAPPQSGVWQYRIQVTDDTGTTVNSGENGIFIRDDDDDSDDRIDPDGPRSPRTFK